MNEAQTKQVISMLDQIAASDKKKKMELISEYVRLSPTFKKVLIYALDTSKTFKVSRVKYVEEGAIEGDVFEFLDELDAKPAANARDKAMLTGLANQSEFHLDIVNRILRGRLDAGFDIKTVLKACPGLVSYSPYCRCSGVDEIDRLELDRPESCGYSQLKANGMFVNIFTRPDGTKFTTRKGNVLALPDILKDRFKNFPAYYVLMGEAMVLTPNRSGFLPRAEGNAIITKAIHGTIAVDEASRIVFLLWDMVPEKFFLKGEWAVEYHVRFSNLVEVIQGINKSGVNGVNIIETLIVNDLDAAWVHYEDIRSRQGDLEGTVVKSPKAVWFDGTSKYQIKLKAEKECECLCIGWKPGKPGGKYENCIGSLTVQSSCGKLTGDVSGLSDAEREMDPDVFIGRIIGVKFNEISKSSKTEIRSFDHGRFTGIRHDKNEADSLEYILNLKEAKRSKS